MVCRVCLVGGSAKKLLEEMVFLLEKLTFSILGAVIIYRSWWGVAKNSTQRASMDAGVKHLSVHICLLRRQARVKIPGTNWKQWRNTFQWVPGSL